MAFEFLRHRQVRQGRHVLAHFTCRALEGRAWGVVSRGDMPSRVPPAKHLKGELGGIASA